MIIILLILFFSILIINQLIELFNNKSYEGFENDNEYKPYNTNDPNNTLILAQQNAGNIEYIKKRLDDYNGMNDKVATLNSRVDSLQEQVNGLMTAQKEYATEIGGDTAPNITGATIDEEYSSSIQNVEVVEDKGEE